MARISLDKSKTLDAAAKAGIVGLKCLAAASQVTLSTLTRMLTRDRGASRPYVIAVVRTLYPKDPRSMDELMAELDGRSIASEPPTPTHGELVDMACQVGKAIADCDRVLRTLGQSADAESQVHVGAALGEKGVIAGALGDVEAEFAAYDEIVARFEKSEVATLQHLVGLALNDKARRLSETGGAQAAVPVCDQTVNLFGASEDPELQQCVAQALFTKGIVLLRLDDADSSLDALAEIPDRFSTSDVPQLQQYVSGVRKLIKDIWGHLDGR